MIDTRDWSKLGGLLFVARRAVEGLWAGRHVSPRFGSGLEFHDYRAYSPGDNIAQVDWKLFGRTDRCYVRRHELVTDLHAYLLVDCSGSMNFAGLDRRGRTILPSPTGIMSKLQYAQTLAAAIAYLAVRQSDRAGVGLFAQRLLNHLPPGGTWPHLQRVVSTLEKAHPRTGPGDIRGSLMQAHTLMKRRGLVVVISDLLDEPALLFEGLSRFRHDRFDLIVFQVLTPQELNLAQLGDLQLQLVDLETIQQVPTAVMQIQRDYQRLMAEHITTIRRGCAARGIDYNLLRTDEPVISSLRRYVVQRGAIAR